MVSGVGVRDPMPAFLYLYVADADASYDRALDTGAVSLETEHVSCLMFIEFDAWSFSLLFHDTRYVPDVRAEAAAKPAQGAYWSSALP